ncbi:hypothetical protein ACRCP3_26865 [Pseudomonas aeruginosa]|uniref:hypothetical protein n=1 Tax=Pseudomonas aeruginosa TaxID=287 RepID=UPI00227A4F6E|nr:hypothetical protein [Pseudomonas aeruginosa]WAJ88604.1 hypothetical protein PAC13_34955 [Pseudomonas aeruginosa]
MRIPRRGGEAVIVLGGRRGAYSFGLWASVGACCGVALVVGAVRILNVVGGWVGATLGGWL